MKTQPLTNKMDYSKINFENQDELNEVKAEEIEIMVAILKEIHAILQITDSLSMTHISRKYNFDPEYQKCLIAGNVLKKEKEGRLNRWEWISPKQPDKQMALHLFKETDHPLFKEDHPYMIRIKEGFKMNFELDVDIESLPKIKNPRQQLILFLDFLDVAFYIPNNDQNLLHLTSEDLRSFMLGAFNDTGNNISYEEYKLLLQDAVIHSHLTPGYDEDGILIYIYGKHFIQKLYESEMIKTKPFEPKSMVDLSKAIKRKKVPDFEFTKVNTDYSFIQWLMEHEDRAFYDQLSQEEYDFLESIEDHYKATGKLSGKQVAWYSYYKTLAAYRYSKS